MAIVDNIKAKKIEILEKQKELLLLQKDIQFLQIDEQIEKLSALDANVAAVQTPAQQAP